MPEQSNNPFNFWNELKRRKVFRVIVMYAGVAYIIIELVNNVAEPLHLPDWIATLVILLLIIGFPIVAILSWIFDITPEGLKKTESVKVAKGKVQPESAKRKLKVSDLIIVVLLVAVVILAYPRIFKRGADLNSMTNTATIVNEFGEKETRQVFKEEYVHKLMITPFQPEETDSIDQWFKYGILDGISKDLSQFHYMLTYDDEDAIHLQEQVNSAKMNGCPYFLTGTYKITNGNIKITSRLHQTINGSVEKERIYQGDDLFSLFDSISLQTRIDLGVSGNIINSFLDLPFQEFVTGNFDAYRYYILGYYSKLLSTNFYINLSQAIVQDSTFAFASYYYAWYLHNYQLCKISARKYINLALRHRQKLPEYQDIQIRTLNYSIFGEKEKAIALSEMQYELQPYNIRLLRTLFGVYTTNLLFDKAEEATEKLNELVPDFPEYQIALANSYLLSNKLDKGLKYIKKRIEENPEHKGFLYKKGQFLLHKGDLDNAEKVFQKAILVSPEDKNDWSALLDHINFARNKTQKSDNLQKFTGRYRLESIEMYWDIIIHNDHLFGKGGNQGGWFQYQTSDTSTTSSYAGSRFFNRNYSIDKQGKVFRCTAKYSSLQSFTTHWKHDSMILHAEKLLESNRHQEALATFQQAYIENPEHYYPANYIRHLEFTLSEEYEKIKPVLDSYTGDYGYLKISKEKNQFLLNFKSITDFKLLPLSEDQFMNPSQHDYLLKVVKEDNQIIGLKAIIHNGGELFFKRIDEQALARERSEQ